MKRRDFVALAGAASIAVALPRIAMGQGARKVPRVALVTGAIAVDQMHMGRDVNWSALLEQMQARGYVEGRNVSYDRWLLAAANAATGNENAKMILATVPDLIFWGGATTTAVEAIKLNKTIPMVAETGDLLTQGLVANVARPGANLTGVSTTVGPEYEGKRLALLAETVPLAKVFAYTNSGVDGQFRPTALANVEVVTAAAARLGLKMVPIVYAAGGGETELKKVFDKIAAAKADIALLGNDTALTATTQQVIAASLAKDKRIATMAADGGYSTVGGLLGYGPDYPVLARRCADYLADILEGARPGDMPVSQPEVFDFAVNLKTANAIGVTIPQSVLLQATRLIS